MRFCPKGKLKKTNPPLHQKSLSLFYEQKRADITDDKKGR
jgi:hypothetical protein